MSMREKSSYRFYFTVFFAIIVCLSFIFTAAVSKAHALVINEFMASNDTTIADENGEYDDWVEIYNPTTSAVDLAGMSLTDDLSEPGKSTVPFGSPSTLVPAGGFVILWFDGSPEQGPLHVDAKLSGGGEQIGLFAADGSAIDSLTYGPQATDISQGRSPDGSDAFAFFTNPTPLTENGTGSTVTTAEPTASQLAGFRDATFTVTLDSATSGADIYYTLDATEPTTDSLVYSGPLTIASTTTLRARAFASSQLPSPIATWTWLFGVSHAPGFAVVAVTADPEDVFGENGIYTKYEEDIEIDAHFELFEPDGTLGISQRVETEIHGSASASLPQKSLAIKAHSRFGIDELRYPIFPDQPFDVYRSLILRNSGQDWNYTMFRDASTSSLVRDLSDVGTRIEPIDVIAQGHRPAVLYLNGSFWGIHNIRDRFDRRYIKARYDLERDEIDFLDEETEAKEGDFVAWNAFQAFLSGADLSNPADFATFTQWVDVPAYIDHYAFQIAVDNADWPGNNNRRFRERTANAQWQFMIKDLDFSTGLFVQDGPWNSGDWTQDSLNRLLTPDWDWWPNPPWSTLSFQRAVENSDFRRDFINRSADMLNVLFGPARWNARIDTFETTYAPEIQRHLDRWNSGWNAWASHVGVLRTFASNRADAVRGHYIDNFTDINGTAEVNISAEGGGTLVFSTVRVEGGSGSYTGTWFTGIDIPVRAEPAPGFVFDRWSGAASGSGASTTVTLFANTSITAHFVEDTPGDRNPQTIDFDPLPNRFTNDSPFTIAATATSGLPVTFQIISGPASLDETTITLTGEVGTVVVRANQWGDDDWLAAPAVDRSFTVSLSDTGGSMPTGYCSSRGDEPWQSWILRVQFAGIDHTSVKEGYGDFATEYQTAVQRGAINLVIELTPEYSWERFLNTWRVWIDWNRDGDFDDAGELAVDTPATNEVVTGQISVPSGASLGTTRMRVSMKRYDAAQPCENFVFGEVQDYAVVIGGDSNDDRDPQSIDFDPLPDRFTDDDPFDVAATATSGLPVSFQIISGPAEINGSTVTLTGEEGTVLVRANQWGDDNWLAAPAVDRTFAVRSSDTGGPMPDGYCSSSGEKPWQSWMLRLQFAGIDHTSVKEGYGDFSDEYQAVVQRGDAGLFIQLSPEYSWERFLNTWRVWIDWNRDGDFNDAGELALDIPATNEVVTGQISVPPGASPGVTRMRVTMKRNDSANPCDSFEFGEVQDYAVEIR